ncbi:ABC transporter ATP-binding protein [Paraburkholderia rhizosphaerae]|uniref:Putative ABC transport system ATP-binding protein n=1 Tax=Paraburkholderia rhizosphaerae TaxID=480658 RepID=A0A4R8M2H1_9BURK|nr:ABC transporter ATP-binding protein [Paraburkholderia rhizosphaerae]TDY53955.1 putative ABC transport system ATP-binding protein [Paraburkholderia rhizosphaerae]
MLTLSDVTKRYPGNPPRTVLNRVSLELREGECVAIMGESGTGKSTLLNLAAGLDMPDNGRIEFDGHDLATLDDDRRTLLRRARMGFVFQAFHVLPNLSAAQNVALPLRLNGVSAADVTARVASVLASVGLADRADTLPRELSGGELQRIAIARALVHRPGLVLADEPTGNLDHDTATRILQLLRDMTRQSRAAVLLVTHSTAAAASADRVLRLTRDGLAPYAPPVERTL